MAVQAALLANIHRDKKKKAFGVEDFMPDWTGERTEERRKSNMAGFKTMLNSMRGKKRGS